MAKKRNDESGKLDEELSENIQVGDVDAVKERFSSSSATSIQNSWDYAATIVKNVRPVPSVFWRIIRAVLGQKGEVRNPDPLTFDIVRPLIMRAAADKILGNKFTKDHLEDGLTLKQAVAGVSPDVIAALCLMHGVCRRVGTLLSERVWRPIVDDALLRAHIGYLLGKKLSDFGSGRGMLAGFSGRSGLVVQIASGDLTKAQRALEGLASGVDMQEVGLRVYGCDPLQVAAMTLAAAGLSSDASVGIASFSHGEEGVTPRSFQYLWLSAFAISEHARVAQWDKIEPRFYKAFRFTEAAKDEFQREVQTLLRKGHNWGWICAPQSEKEKESSEEESEG